MLIQEQQVWSFNPHQDLSACQERRFKKARNPSSRQAIQCTKGVVVRLRCLRLVSVVKRETWARMCCM